MSKTTTRPTAAQLRTARFATLYPNGVVILQHEKEDREAGTVHWSTAWETTLYTNQAMHFSGNTSRILFLPSFRGIRFIADNGSIASRERGLTVQGISFEYDGFSITTPYLPGVLSGDVRPVERGYDDAPDMATLRTSGRWLNCPITNL